jgi:hypothetical protein
MTMESRVSKALGLAVLALLMFSIQFAAPAHAQLGSTTARPIWVTVNASAQGNYPGGDELFTVFVVNSAQNATETVTVDNMTLTAPFQSNFGAGLPTTLLPGQSVLVTIHLGIPSNFSQNSFTANLVVHTRLWNGTAYLPLTLTGTAPVNVFALASQPVSQPAAESGTVSTTLFAAGVAAPSIVAILLLVLLIRGRASPKQ